MPRMLRSLLLLIFVLAGFTAAWAEPEKRIALSLIRTPKYAAGFAHFDDVNPDAPKGGIAKLSWPAAYDNLNVAIYNGDIAPGLALVYDTLMRQSLDEPATAYCLLCEWVSVPDDLSSVTFKLRDDAKWHDGQPVTADDVIFSMETMKAKDPKTGAPYNPLAAQYYKNVVKAEKTGDRQVTFTFNTKNNRELPYITGELQILPKHYWTATGPDGKPRNIAKPTLEAPLGSGPYKIAAMQPGEMIAYERVPDYWAANLPVAKGYDNFDRIEFQHYGNPTVSLEAFKSNHFDYNVENSAKNWATAYDFPAVKEGKVVKREIALQTPKPMQGFIFNLRRSKFDDARTRRAFNLALNFEWMNQNIFYGQYKRTSSYFEGQELAATGLPSPAELKLLEPLRDKVPPEVFTAEYKNPVNVTEADFRNHLREAARLLDEVGWKVVNGQRQNAAGEPLSVEFLIYNDQFERVVLPYIDNLKRIGIQASLRLVDPSEYTRREDNFDFDIVIATFGQSQSPGNEQRYFWGSAAADQPGSRNLIGIKNPAVDALVDDIIFAKDRDDLVAACRALDRVLLWNYYLVPNWYTPAERVAYWSKFGAPNPAPTQAVGFPEVWWYDAALAQKNGLK